MREKKQAKATTTATTKIEKYNVQFSRKPAPSKVFQAMQPGF